MKGYHGNNVILLCSFVVLVEGGEGSEGKENRSIPIKVY